jgi:hypothetical protein
MAAIGGGLLVAFGIVLVVSSLTNINRHPHEPNSPFIWVFLMAGLLMTGFGAAILWVG